MNPAKASRIAKERHPERYCPAPNCLWRVQHFNTVFPYLDDTPCPKHMKNQIASTEKQDAKPEVT